MNGKRSPFSNSVYSQLGEAYQHYCLVPKSTFDKDALTCVSFVNPIIPVIIGYMSCSILFIWKE